ncbi:hypothetical protein BC936DRAFT_138672 [Jimgerdemannia flammicorona]|uniref:PHD-type domain-containing protein n=1 Tax=Jimgerdemannia flammicorona TaxID=994334 RepID=A0A433BUD0_9FUNG|nr:hypothetical protein BC936DRAFT_138672 [Jimgerdemannia flammicorona]
MILKVIPFGVENATEETVKVQKQDKVSLLRRLISDKYGKDKCPLDRLRLIYMGKVVSLELFALEDLTADGIEAILYNTYGVKENQVINISLKVILSREPSVAPATITSAAASESSFVPPLELRASTSSSVEPEKQPEPEFVIPPELIEEEPYICPRCKNDPRVTKCKECGCQQCGGKEGNPMICDQCNMYWHVECVGLDKLPEEDEWFCPECENKDVDIVIGEGQGIKSSSRKAKMPSANQTKKWGGGMACAGKQVSCIIGELRRNKVSWFERRVAYIRGWAKYFRPIQANPRMLCADD